MQKLDRILSHMTNVEREYIFNKILPSRLKAFLQGFLLGLVCMTIFYILFDYLKTL